MTTNVTVTGTTATVTDDGTTVTVTAASTSTPAWGSISGTLANQTDLTSALTGKADDAQIFPTPAKSTWWVSGVNGNTAASLVADQLLGNFFPVTSTLTLDRIGVYIFTSGASGSLIRLGIFKMDANGVDMTRVLDAGTIDGTQAAGAYSITISQSLTPGLYVIGAAGQGSPATQPVMLGSNSNNAVPAYMTASTSQGNLNSACTGVVALSVSGALASSYSAYRASAEMPAVHVRVA